MTTYRKTKIAALALGVSLGTLHMALGATALELVQRLGITAATTEDQARAVLQDLAHNPGNFEAIQGGTRTIAQIMAPPPPPPPGMIPPPPPPPTAAAPRPPAPPAAPTTAVTPPEATPAAGRPSMADLAGGMGRLKPTTPTTPATPTAPTTPAAGASGSGTPGAADIAAQAQAKAQGRQSISGSIQSTAQKIDKLNNNRDEDTWKVAALDIVQAPDLTDKMMTDFLNTVQPNRLKYLSKIATDALGTINPERLALFNTAMTARVAEVLKSMATKVQYNNATDAWQ